MAKLGLVAQFEDRQAGGFFFTGALHEGLIVRSKNLTGGGNLPVGNGVAALVLLDLNAKTGEARYLETAKRTRTALAGVLHGAPLQVEHLVLADSILRGRKETTEAASATRADAEHRGDIVTTRLYLSQRQAKPGTLVKIGILLDIADGFHLYAPSAIEQEGAANTKQSSAALSNASNAGNELDNGLPSASRIETAIRFIEDQSSSHNGFSVGSAEFPQATMVDDEVFGGRLAIYEGRRLVVLPLVIAEDAPTGEHPVRVEVRFQACDHQKCLRPETIVLESSVAISPSGDGVLQHQRLFQRETSK